ncbi:hypothetical protein VSP76_26850, partial [Klebsiella pneumoniae]|nr:hypothetical protein [Klebsiella pneumoniae]
FSIFFRDGKNYLMLALVMEVNASPGLEGVETTTGVDVAGKMIAWIERQATPEFCLKIGG